MKRIKNANSIYKYCSEEIAELVLSSKAVRLSTPDMFNDPYDTNIIFNDADMKVVKEALLNYHLDRIFKQVIKEHYANFKPYQKFIGYFAKLTIKLNELTNAQTKQFAPAMNYSKMIRVFNKLGLKNGKIGSPSQNALEEYISVYSSNDIQNQLSEKLHSDAQGFLITCFSKTYDSTLMWSHYANKNKGVCIEFENEGFLEVQYAKSREPIRLKRIIAKILWSYHVSENIQLTELNNKLFLMTIMPLLTKSLEWSYEEEIRCIVKESNSKVLKTDDCYLYRLSTIKSITLGCRTDINIERNLINIGKKSNIDIYKMQLSNDTFDMERVKIHEKV
jgi:hypothetical protein